MRPSTDAMMNDHLYVLPQSWKQRDLFPNVEIELPFAAESELLDSWSLAKSRLLSMLSTAEAITGDQPSRFRMVCTYMVWNNVFFLPKLPVIPAEFGLDVGIACVVPGSGTFG